MPKNALFSVKNFKNPRECCGLRSPDSRFLILSYIKKHSQRAYF